MILLSAVFKFFIELIPNQYHISDLREFHKILSWAFFYTEDNNPSENIEITHETVRKAFRRVAESSMAANITLEGGLAFSGFTGKNPQRFTLVGN
ncbi:hypothetical protein J6590_024944 [Homalodisca vitripennis]|nr:hypothetical protein J6590_024944 [Homalodisca vitripennis]